MARTRGRGRRERSEINIVFATRRTVGAAADLYGNRAVITDVEVDLRRRNQSRAVGNGATIHRSLLRFPNYRAIQRSG